MDSVTLLAIAFVVTLAVAMVVFSEYVLALPLKLIASYGWSDIANIYPDRHVHTDQQFYFCTIGINSMRYRSCTIISISDGFVNLACMFPFRFFHPTISLPVTKLQLSSNSVKKSGLTKFNICDTSHSVWLPPRIVSKLPVNQSECD